jgi:protein-serine/threonine kinase
LVDGESVDGPDKPAHGKPTMTSLPNNKKSAQNNMPNPAPAPANTASIYMPLSDQPFSVPLPPPEAKAYEKQPGHTRKTLQNLAISNPPYNDQNHVSSGSESDWGDHSSPATNPSSSRPPSQPPSQPPSRPASRAPSMSIGESGNKVDPSDKDKDKETTSANMTSTTTVVAVKKPSSVHSDTGGHRFNLKDLLASAPKIPRRSSQRSVGSRSSRRSDSDAGSDGGKAGDKAKSTAGDSTTSLSKKYGVCQKVAIGKGATSVVKLAHKWDRSEEKLYAVKVSHPPKAPPISCRSSLTLGFVRNSGNAERTSQRRSTSRN